MNRGFPVSRYSNLLWELPNGALLHSPSRRLSLALFSLSAVVPAAALAVALWFEVGAHAPLTVALCVFLWLAVGAATALAVLVLLAVVVVGAASAARAVALSTPVYAALLAPPMGSPLIAMPRSVCVTV